MREDEDEDEDEEEEENAIYLQADESFEVVEEEILVLVLVAQYILLYV